MSSEKSGEAAAPDPGEAVAALVPAESRLMLSPEAEKELMDQLRQILPNLAPPQMQGVLSVVEETFSREVHSGPLPPPSQLAAYKEVGENFAERIFQMAEREQGHRHRMEQRIVTATITSHWFGLGLAFVVSLLLMAGAGYTALHDQPWVAGAFLATSAVGMVSAFIRGSRMGVFGQKASEDDEEGGEPGIPSA